MLFLMVLCVLTGQLESIVYHGISNLYKPPSITMQYRIIRDVTKGANARITLIYHSSRATSVRWFRGDQSQSQDATGMEVPGFFPIDGDTTHWVEYLTSDDVISVTLHMRRFNDEFPVDYYTIITTMDSKVQYNIRTTISQPTKYDLHFIRSPEYLVPLEDVHFSVGGSLSVGCLAIVPYELETSDQTKAYMYNSLNVLELHRVIGTGKLRLDQDTELIMRSKKDIDPHERTNTTEQGPNPNTFLSEYREPMKLNHVKYYVNLTTTSADKDLEGVYQCKMSRQDESKEVFETYYINSNVLLQDTKSPYEGGDKSLYVMVKSCTGEVAMENHQMLHLPTKSGETKCVRCISMGFPRPELSLFQKVGKRNESVVDRDILFLDSVNVAKGGTVEATIIFRSFESRMAKEYFCRAENSVSVRKAHFKLEEI